MASAVLAREVGYPGSSIAFAQLLSGMERSGLIEREVRGKRTYRIRPTAAALAGVLAATEEPARRGAVRPRAASPGRARAGAPRPGRGGAGSRAADESLAAGPAGFDYDELARQLLVQVIRQLASMPGEAPTLPPGPDQAELANTELANTVAGLERELASARTLHGALTAENARLREQLRATRRSLTLARQQGRGRAVTEQLDGAEVGLLERLLSPAGEEPG